MATELKRRRGTAAQHATFTGAQGEVTVDLTNKSVVVHDGVTPGGERGAKASELIASAISTTPSGNLASTTQSATNAELDAQRKHINRIINGGFYINQRVYVSAAATTAGQYTLDRWKVTGTGGITFSTTANKTTVTIPSGQALQQVIEGLNLNTGTYVLSWEGTAQGKIGAGSLGASGITGAITGGTNTTIEFAPGTVANVQLELGEVATPFEYRLDELALCELYYEQHGPGYRVNITTCANNNTTTTAGTFNYKTKRGTPTIAATGTWRVIGGNTGASVSIAFSEITNKEARITGTGTGFTIGGANMIQSEDGATGTITISSEL